MGGEEDRFVYDDEGHVWELVTDRSTRSRQIGDMINPNLGVYNQVLVLDRLRELVQHRTVIRDQVTGLVMESVSQELELQVGRHENLCSYVMNAVLEGTEVDEQVISGLSGSLPDKFVCKDVLDMYHRVYGCNSAEHTPFALGKVINYDSKAYFVDFKRNVEYNYELVARDLIAELIDENTGRTMGDRALRGMASEIASKLICASTGAGVDSVCAEYPRLPHNFRETWCRIITPSGKLKGGFSVSYRLKAVEANLRELAVCMHTMRMYLTGRELDTASMFPYNTSLMNNFIRIDGETLNTVFNDFTPDSAQVKDMEKARSKIPGVLRRQGLENGVDAKRQAFVAHGHAHKGSTVMPSIDKDGKVTIDGKPCKLSHSPYPLKNLKFTAPKSAVVRGLWSTLFSIDAKNTCNPGVFEFGSTIMTDGYSVRILYESHALRPACMEDAQSVEYVGPDTVADLHGVNRLVGIDPNLSNLMYGCSLKLGDKAPVDVEELNEEVNMKKMDTVVARRSAHGVGSCAVENKNVAFFKDKHTHLSALRL